MTAEPDVDALLDLINEEARLMQAFVIRHRHDAVLAAFGRFEQMCAQTGKYAVCMATFAWAWANVVAAGDLIHDDPETLPGIDEAPLVPLTEASAKAIETMVNAAAAEDQASAFLAFGSMHGDDRVALMWHLLYAAGATTRDGEQRDGERPSWSEMVVATTDVVRRVGASRFELSVLDDGRWWASAWARDPLTPQADPGPVPVEGDTLAEACDELARKLLHGKACSGCGRKIDARTEVRLAPGFKSPALPCIWHRAVDDDGSTWVRGCDGGAGPVPLERRHVPVSTLPRAERRARRRRSG